MMISVVQLVFVCFLNVIGVAELKPGNIVIVNNPMTAFCSGDFIFLSAELAEREYVVQHEYMHMTQYSRLREKYFILVATPSVVSYWIGFLAVGAGADLEFILSALRNMPWEKENYGEFEINS